MTVDAQARQEPKSTLQDMEVHSSWMQNFRTAENDAFFNLAFDYVASQFGAANDQVVLDAGCGSGVKSVHLAKRGYRVLGIDFSHAILDHARQNAAAAGVSERTAFAQGDLTALTQQTGSIKRALCWGVLMHVPDISMAVSELARIIAPGGVLIVSEGNFRSAQSTSLRWIKGLLRRERAEVIRTPAGIEFWEHTSTGRLMTRRADIPWLIAAFDRHGLKLVHRRAGQFTEIYTVTPWRHARRLIHAFNNLWFRFVRLGGPAFGNILVFARKA